MFDGVLDRALRDKVRNRRAPLAAVDGTGMESRHVSRYYVKRRSKTGTGTQETTYSRCPKVVLVADCRSHLVLAAVPGRGPASDLVLFKAALRDAAGRARIGTLLADADFDGEWVHEHVRSYGIRTLIPPERGRPSDKPPAGRWRRWMRAALRRFKAKYGQPWQAEAVNSMVKRRLGSALRARGYWSQCREIILRVITHNVMIVARIRAFYRALLTPLCRRPGGAGAAAPPRRRPRPSGPRSPSESEPDGHSLLTSCHSPLTPFPFTGGPIAGLPRVRR